MISPLRAVRLGARSLRTIAGAAACSSYARFPRAAERLLDPFRDHDHPGPADFEGLFHYFLEGWDTYREADGASASYPGARSWSGRRLDAMEGFSRNAPLWGAWVHGGRPRRVERFSGGSMDLIEMFVRGVVAGTDRSGPSYWGDITGPSDQRIVEAADVALALWLFGEPAWDRLSAMEQTRLMQWLAQVHRQPGLDNNWHLFFLVIDRVQQRFGHGGAESHKIARHWERIKVFHLGDGWFRDGPGGEVDYYNAWSFHYTLYWLHRMDPELEPGFIREALRSFAAGYRHLIGPEGLPFLGRSVSYRMAAPAPLVLAQSWFPEVVSPGEARRGLQAVWTHFVRRGAVRRGTVTQGYYGPDLRVLDNYSGPASPLWSLRSLAAALAFGPDADLWTAPREPLPVERGKYSLILDAPGWRVDGDPGTGTIRVEVLSNDPDARNPLHPYRLVDRLRAAAHERPLRPANTAAKFHRRYYASAGPHCIVSEGGTGAVARLAARIFPY